MKVESFCFYDTFLNVSTQPQTWINFLLFDIFFFTSYISTTKYLINVKTPKKYAYSFILDM